MSQKRSLTIKNVEDLSSVCFCYFVVQEKYFCRNFISKQVFFEK